MTISAEARLDTLGFQHGMLEPKQSGAARWSVWLLVISVSVNVAVIAFLVFQMQDGVLWFEVETKEPSSTIVSESSKSESLKSELSQLSSKSDDELLRTLDDEKGVANGYRIQELALALLRSRGYQVEDPLRPLGAWPQPMPPFSWTDAEGKSCSVRLFSNVGLREIQAVKTFILETSVPFTAEGIVRKLKEGQDSTLMRSALFRTDEWSNFSRVFSSLSEEELLLFSKDLGPEAFSSIVEWGHVHTDAKDIGPFVVSLFSKTPSSFLAELVALNYADSVVLQASDDTVLLLYSYLPAQSEAGVRLAMRLLHGQRKLPVWQASQAYLARAASMPTLSSMNRDQVLEWFQQMAHPTKAQPATSALPAEEIAVKKPETHLVQKTEPDVQPKKVEESAPQKVVTLKPTPQKIQTPASRVSARVATRQLQPYRTYIIRKGDTLWSVAKRFNVDVEKLKYLNGLKGTTLTPGKPLKIPH